MRFHKLVGTLAAATVSLAAMTGIAQAQTVAAFGGATPGASDITFNENTGIISSVPGGSLVTITSNASGAVNIPAFFTFGPSTLVSTNVGPGNVITSVFGPGSVNFGTVAGGSDLLNATFSSVTLIGGTDSGTLLNFSNATTYASGTLANAFVAQNGGTIPFNGTLSIGLTSFLQTSPRSISATGGTLDSFTAQSIGGTLSASPNNPVPEPSEWLAMGMAATSVGGLMFRAKLKLRTKRQQVAA